MDSYLGGIYVKTFPNNIKGYLTEFNNVLIDIADHDHTGGGNGTKLHGTNAIQPGTITAASIADGTITVAKLASGSSFTTIANNTYLKWRNAANSADLDVIKINASDKLEFAQDIFKMRLANNVVFKGATAAAADYSLFKVNASDQWEFLNTARAQTILPKTTNTYDLGDSSTPLRWQRVHLHNLRFANGGTDLTWYEEGSWTPVMAGSSSAGTGTYTTQVGRFVRVGALVMVWFTLVITAHTGTGNMTVTGLPYTSSNIANAYHTGNVMIENAAYAGGSTGYLAYVGNNVTKMDLVTGLTGTTVAGISVDASCNIKGSLVYTVGMT